MGLAVTAVQNDRRAPCGAGQPPGGGRLRSPLFRDFTSKFLYFGQGSLNLGYPE